MAWLVFAGLVSITWAAQAQTATPSYDLLELRAAENDNGLTETESEANMGYVRSSLLLLIDSSGSMGQEIGQGNPEIKIEVAKAAAIAALGRATDNGLVEAAVLAFEGDCQNPVPRYLDFTADINRLTVFIETLRPGGGTPMAEALLFANRFMRDNSQPVTTTKMIFLLADGQNDCGDVNQALEELRGSGLVFRHETVGFGIEPNSDAARDLRHIATVGGGVYHHAADATQLVGWSTCLWSLLIRLRCWTCLEPSSRCSLIYMYARLAR